MGRNRKPCCEKEVVKKGAWSSEEDQVLVDYIQKHGASSWRALPKNAGLPRCGKSCRLRWTNYLRPGIKRGPFSPEEEAAILRLHGMLGNKWSAIASQLPGRTDNEIKNFWNTHLKKRTFPALGQSSPVGKSDGSSSKPIKMEYDESSLSRYMVQREDAGVEAEARLSKRSELLHSPTERFKYDPILWLWNSEVGESFRNTKGKDESTSGNPIAQLQASSSVKLECSSAANSDQGTPVKTSTSTDSSYKQEDSYSPNLHVTAGSDSISSNEFSDSSDKALKLLLNDFPGANDMDFVQGDQGESFCDFLDLRCD